MAQEKNPRPSRDGGTQTLEKSQVRTQRPRLWRVILHNDDYTTQEFVVFVLVRFFRKDVTEATQLMLKVHTSGRAIVGLYTREIAETKVDQVTDAAREEGHPLLVTMEPDSDGEGESPGA